MKAIKKSTISNQIDYHIETTPYNVKVTRHKKYGSLYYVYGNGPLNGSNGRGGIRRALEILSN
jgi:hypothetical protein